MSHRDDPRLLPQGGTHAGPPQLPGGSAAELSQEKHGHEQDQAIPVAEGGPQGRVVQGQPTRLETS